MYEKPNKDCQNSQQKSKEILNAVQLCLFCVWAQNENFILICSWDIVLRVYNLGNVDYKC